MKEINLTGVVWVKVIFSNSICRGQKNRKSVKHVNLAMLIILTLIDPTMDILCPGIKDKVIKLRNHADE